MTAEADPETEADPENSMGRGIDGFRGAQLRRLRIRAKLTQNELAKIADVSAGEISHLECNRRRPTVLTLRKLCHALGVEPDDMLDWDDDEARPVVPQAAAPGEP